MNNLILYHKPNKSYISSLKDVYGALTILTDKEGGSLVASTFRYYGIINWQHKYTIKHHEEVSLCTWEQYKKELDDIAELLREEKRILVHCSAGIHRTGTNGYALLRRLGYSRKDSYEIVCSIRPESSDCIRFLDWAEEYII